MVGMPSKKEIADFARDCYKYEPSTKRAVDKRVITIRELTIYHYINAYLCHNTPLIEGDAAVERQSAENESLQKAYRIASRIYRIKEATAREIFDKVNRIQTA